MKALRGASLSNLLLVILSMVKLKSKKRGIPNGSKGYQRVIFYAN